MIKAVFFDLYNTLVRFEPPPERQQAQACREFGLMVEPESFRRAFLTAAEFLIKENARLPISQRSQEEQDRFWVDYELTLLRAAGVEARPELAARILERVRGFESRLVFYEDVPPTLSRLRQQGLKLGLVSNLDCTLEEFCRELEVKSFFDFTLISYEVGIEKPRPEIFRLALRLAQVEPGEAIHVGDQYLADVVGAKRAGIKALLLDREGLLEDHHDCERIRSLSEIIYQL